MDFIPLDNEERLKEISEAKGTNIIFKHNTTCPISRSVIKKLEQDAGELPQNTPVYVLDLIEKREISNAVSKIFDIPHESPQLLLIKNGSCIYNQSLYNISAKETAAAIKD